MDKQILDYIERYILQFGYAPTYKEIGLAVGLASSSSVHLHVKKLLKQGKLETDHEGESRALRSPRISITRKNTKEE